MILPVNRTIRRDGAGEAVAHIGRMLGRNQAPPGVWAKAFAKALCKFVQAVSNVCDAAILGILQRSTAKRRESRRKYRTRIQ
jgi:hypothetical protein